MNADHPPAPPALGTAVLSRPERLPVFRLKRHITIAAETDDRLQVVPYVTRGRDLETAIMAQSIQSAPSAVRFITGARGVGKSALMANIKQLARAWGCTVITLETRHFRRNRTLAEEIWRQGSPSGQAYAHQRTVEAEQAVSPCDEMRGGGTAVEVGAVEVNRLHDWRDALQAVDAANPGRPTVFFVDDVQYLGRNHQDLEVWNCAADILHFFHSDVFSMAAGTRPQAALICAGLLNDSQFLDEFDIDRCIYPMRLGPLGDEAARAILQDYMTARTLNGDPLPTVPNEVIEELIQASAGSAHHIAAAGLAAQKEAEAALQAGLTMLDVEACERIMEETRKRRAKLYGQSIAPSDGSAIADVAMALAQATLTHGTELSTIEAQSLIHRINRGHAEPQSDILNELQWQGIIEFRACEDRYPTRAKDVDQVPRYVFAIPGLATWLNEQRHLIDRGGVRTGGYDAVIRETMGSDDETSRISPWRWDYGKKLPHLEPMPTADRVAWMNDRVDHLGQCQS